MEEYFPSQDGSFPQPRFMRPSVVNVSDWLTIPEGMDRRYVWYAVQGGYADNGAAYHHALSCMELFCGELDGSYGAWIVVHNIPDKVGIDDYWINAAWQALNVDMSVYPSL